MKSLYKFLGSLWLLTSAYALSAQQTYLVATATNAGNPGGLNPEDDFSTAGWTAITTGGLSANAWSANQTLPFAFNFYGNAVTQFKVSANMLLTFDVAGALPAGNNTALPAATLPNNTIAGMWDEFTNTPPIGTNDIVEAKVFGVAPNRQLWVRWFSFEVGNPSAGFIYSAIVLEETTNRIHVVDMYGTASPLLTSTIGVQLNPTTAVQAGTATTPQAGNGTANADNDYWTFSPILLQPNNAGILNMLNPTSPGAAGNQNVNFTLRNYGSNALNSAIVNWSVNGAAQTPFNYSGALASLSNATLTAGSFNFPVGYHRIKAWTSLPNNTADLDNANDTINTFFCTPLAGTYTVGTPGSDFPTLQEAANALNTCGVGGAVVMNLAPNTYTGQVRLGKIAGTSATNTITFEGNNQATISHNGTGLNGIATISIEGGDYITFQNMNIATTALSNGWAVLLRDTANWNRFINNNIQMQYINNIANVCGIVATSSFTSRFGLGFNANNTLIQNNRFTGGTDVIHFEGNTTSRTKNNRVLNNTINGYSEYGVVAYNQDSMVVNNNTIFDARNTLGRGIYLSDVMGFDIMSNKVETPDYGIYVEGGNNLTTPTRTAIIANNMVRATSYEALYLLDASFTNIYHNTTNGKDLGFFIGTQNQVRIKNNIFSSDTTYAFQSQNATALAELNYNLYFSNNPNKLIRFGTADYNTLAAWQVASFAHDANSKSGNPIFVGLTDLHVEGQLAYNAGATNTGIATDIDGQARPLNGGFDMGADEFTPPVNDAGVVAMLAPTQPLTPGFNPVNVRVRNFGVAPLTSFQVRWSVNGVAQQPVNYNGAAVPSRTEISMSLGSISLTNAPTRFRFWTVLPNGGADDRPMNDTLDAFTCQPLAGNYTVGTPTSSFPSIEDAVDALNFCGVSAPVQMSVAAGTYNTQISLNQIVGASATNTIIFDGNNQTAMLMYNGMMPNKYGVIELNGTDYITFQNFNIQHTGTTAPAWGIHLSNGANRNIIRSNRISLSYSAGISEVIGVVFSAANNNSTLQGNNANFNLVDNNIITGGEVGIKMLGQQQNGAGTSHLKNDGNKITNNTISGTDDYGIWVEGQDSVEISTNRVSDIRSSVAIGISLRNSMNYALVGNYSASVNTAIGLTTVNVDTVPRYGLVANNMSISNTGYGLFLGNVGLSGIYHNTARGGIGAFVTTCPNFALDVRNNIFMGTLSVALQVTPAISFTSLNYNLYYVLPTVTNLVNYNATNYATLAAWQASGQALDANSRSGNPLFVSNTDLHVQGGLANDAGVNIPLITMDYDMQTRPASGSTTVDIGADEFSISTNDATPLALLQSFANACGNATQPIKISFRNLGTSTITSMSATVLVAGAGSGSITGTYTGSLTNSNIDSFVVGNINTLAGGVYDLTIITTLTADGNVQNDTLRVSVPVRASSAVTPMNAQACMGTSATVSVSPAIGISWYDAPTAGTLLGTGASYTIPALNANTTVYADVAGCAAARVAVMATITTTAGFSLGNDTTVCSTYAVPLSLPSAPMYMWSTGATSQAINANMSGVYSATITDAFNCTATDVITITHLASPTISHAGSNISCAGQVDARISLTLAGGVSPFNVLWSNTQTTQTITGLNAGVYTATITDANTCAYVYSAAVTRPDTLELDSVYKVNPTCEYSVDGQVQLFPIGGTLPYAYLWNTGTTTNMFGGAGQQTFSITITDARGCRITTTQQVVALSQTLISTDSIKNETQNLNGAIYITTTSGRAPFSYLWNTGATTQDLTGLAAGTYSVAIVDSFGCQKRDTFVVQYNIPIVGVTETAGVNSFTAFPNPTNGALTLSVELAQAEEIMVQVYNTNGQLVQTQNVSANTNHAIGLDLNHQASGIYTIRLIIGADKVLNARIVKQ